MPDHRAHFDFEIRFANSGDLTGTGFRLDLPSADLDEAIHRRGCWCITSDSRWSTASNSAGCGSSRSRTAGAAEWSRRPKPKCGNARRRPQPPDPRRAGHLPRAARADHHAAPDAGGLPRQVRAGHRVRDGRHHDDRQHRHVPGLAVPPLRRRARSRRAGPGDARRPARRGVPPDRRVGRAAARHPRGDARRPRRARRRRAAAHRMGRALRDGRTTVPAHRFCTPTAPNI